MSKKKKTREEDEREEEGRVTGRWLGELKWSGWRVFTKNTETTLRGVVSAN